MKNVNTKDLIYVVLIGFIVSTLTGIAVGTVDYLLYTTIGITMKLFYFIGVYFIASYIKRQYVESTKLYQIIAVVFALYGYFFSIVIFTTMYFGLDTFEFMFKDVFSLDYMIDYFNPRNLYVGGFGAFLEYLFLFLFGYIAYSKTK